MSKKKSAKKPRAAAASRRKAAKSRSAARGRRSAAAPPPRKIRLKPIKVLIDRAIADLEKLPRTEPIELTLKHLRTCSMLMSEICKDPDGPCGETMEFDVSALVTSRA